MFNIFVKEKKIESVQCYQISNKSYEWFFCKFFKTLSRSINCKIMFNIFAIKFYILIDTLGDQLTLIESIQNEFVCLDLRQFTLNSHPMKVGPSEFLSAIEQPYCRRCGVCLFHF